MLINILPPSPGVEIATRYESEFLGLRARQDYRVINLWTVEVGLALRGEFPSLLPFAPVLQGGDDEAVVREALGRLRGEGRLRELEPLLAFFAARMRRSRACRLGVLEYAISG